MAGQQGVPGQQGQQQPGVGGQQQAGVGAYDIVRPGLPGPAPGSGFPGIGPNPQMGIKAAAARFAKQAMGMMTPGPGGVQPQPGLTANQPPPQMIPGQVPAGPGVAPLGGGTPTAGGQPSPGGQPQGGQPPAPGGAPGGQPPQGQPGQQQPMTPPMADPMQPPLPTNPRQNSGVQAPMTPQVAQQQNSINSLLSDKVQSESGDDGMMAQGGGMGDMTAATMGMCVKLASDRRRLVLIGLDPKTGHFRLLHRWYLGTSTLQWARSLLLFSTLRAWRAEDARGSTPTGDDPKAGS